MFCTECGQPVRGKFCGECGHPVGGPSLVPVELVIEWEREVCYETIVAQPSVREAIDRHAKQATKRISGEQFLAMADKVLSLGVPLESIAKVTQPLYARLGVKTGKARIEWVAAPVGQVIVRALCSLARRAMPLKEVHQATDGCTIDAVLPSDLFALEGDLTISICRQAQGATVSAHTHIGGQWFDWGKSNRYLEQLFADLRQIEPFRRAA